MLHPFQTSSQIVNQLFLMPLMKHHKQEDNNSELQAVTMPPEFDLKTQHKSNQRGVITMPSEMTMASDETEAEEEFDFDEMIENRKCINCLHSAVAYSKIFCFYHPGRERPEVWKHNFCGSFVPTTEEIMEKRKFIVISSIPPEHELSGEYL